MLFLLSTKCKKLTQWERHVLSAAPQAVFEIAWGNCFEIWYGGEITSILKVILFWDVIAYSLVAKSQQFKRICCLPLQKRSLFCPEDGDSMLFQNVGTFFPTTWGVTSQNTVILTAHIAGTSNFTSWILAYSGSFLKRKLLLKTTNFVRDRTHYEELAHNTVQAEWNLVLFETIVM